MGIGPGAEKAGIAFSVLARALTEVIDDLRFRHLSRNFEVSVQPVFGRNGREELVDRSQAHVLKHGFAVGRRFWKIAHKRLLDVTASQFDCCTARQSDAVFWITFANFFLQLLLSLSLF